MAGLISVTALIMLTLQPQLVFDTGAWLSFLSVAALGWAGSLTAGNNSERDVLPDALTTGERLRAVWSVVQSWLVLRYTQMLAVVAATSPLIAATFHVVSPVALVVNVLLIPVTAVVLCCGFVTLAVGLLVPSAAFVPGCGFSALLKCLTRSVDAASDLHVGHVYIADLPAWFVPVWYSLLVAALLLRPGRWKRAAAISLFASVLLVIAQNRSAPETDRVRCTVLDVGHGNATVVELSNGQVFLVDAGAMNSGERAADVVCRFLWQRGCRELNGILISHADSDHYNSVAEILRQIPVGEVITSRQVGQFGFTLRSGVTETA